MGGVDHALFATNELGQIREQATKSLSTMKDQPFILAPNCSIPITVTDEALKELRNSINN